MASVYDFFGKELETGNDVLFILGSDLRRGKIVAIDAEDVMIREEDGGKIHALETRRKNPTASHYGPGLTGIESVAAALSQRSNIVKLPLP